MKSPKKVCCYEYENRSSKAKFNEKNWLQILSVQKKPK